MTKKHILLHGSTLITNKQLIKQLEKNVNVVKVADFNRIEAIVSALKINLIFLEISDIKSIVLIKKLRAKFPNANILVIKNKVEQKLFARAFACGAKDGFQGFYNCDLIVERVAALLK